MSRFLFQSYQRMKLAQALWKVFWKHLFGRGLDFLERPPPRSDDALVKVSISHLLSEKLSMTSNEQPGEALAPFDCHS